MTTTIERFVAGALCALAAGCASTSVHGRLDGPVAIEGGLVQGAVEGDLHVFRGVPFAAPPIGDLRWRPPAPAERWEGVRESVAFAPECTQNAGGGVEGEEDCLYLNIWSPAESATERLPVMVWIYGGGFGGGSTSDPRIDGSALARRGVVMVSVAYRVGPMGFLAHPDLSAESQHGVSGNYGILDQIAALEWVERNIGAFGGDPERVTIFGESAGAIAVSQLAASPLAQGLFDGAISESGGSFGTVVPRGAFGENMQPLSAAEADGVAFADSVGASSVEDLRAMSAEDIQVAARGKPGLGWPVTDGVVIPDNQYTLYEEGRFNDVPVLIGFNSDDGESFVRTVTPEGYPAYVAERFGFLTNHILTAYPADRPEGARRSARDLARDLSFGWHTWAWAELQSRNGEGDVFLYYFDQRPPYPPDSRFADVEGAPHASEIIYVFENLETETFAWRPEDRQISEAMAIYWTNFAKTGDPNSAGLPAWPAYDPDGASAMVFNGRPEAMRLPNLERVRVLDAYFAARRADQASLAAGVPE